MTGQLPLCWNPSLVPMAKLQRRHETPVKPQVQSDMSSVAPSHCLPRTVLPGFLGFLDMATHVHLGAWDQLFPLQGAPCLQMSKGSSSTFQGLP